MHVHAPGALFERMQREAIELDELVVGQCGYLVAGCA